MSGPSETPAVVWAIPLFLWLLPPLILVWILSARGRRSPRPAAPVQPLPKNQSTTTEDAVSKMSHSHGAPGETVEPATPVAAEGVPRGRKPGFWSVIGWVALAVYLLGVSRDVIRECTPDYRMKPPSLPKLEARIDSYLEIDGLHKQLSTSPLHGRAVIIDKSKGTIHPLMRELPKENRASTPDEVDIVIWIETDRVLIPDISLEVYGTEVQSPLVSPTALEKLNSIPVYHARWSVTIIDLRSKDIKEANSFVGADPPTGSVDFVSPWFSGQICVSVDDALVKGCEVLVGDEGTLLALGRRIVGIVGPTPWEATLKWIDEVFD